MIYTNKDKEKLSWRKKKPRITANIFVCIMQIFSFAYLRTAFCVRNRRIKNKILSIYEKNIENFPYMEIFATNFFFVTKKKLLLRCMIVQNLYWMQERASLFFYNYVDCFLDFWSHSSICHTNNSKVIHILLQLYSL